MPPTNTMAQLCDDLAAEHAALDERVANLDVAAWRTPTPADGWTVADSVSHLAFFDGTATLAATDPERFASSTKALMEQMLATGIDPSLSLGRDGTAAALLDSWRAGRARMLDVFRSLDAKDRLPWYGPPMSAASFATARLMETWAHGQDVADALGLPPVESDRLRHIAHIGVRARPYSYVVRGRTAPDVAITVTLTAPSRAGAAADTWTWAGDPSQRVSGPAVDFALAVTQRRHVLDTTLVVEGDSAIEWMEIAQAFAGPAGPGRAPGMFTA
jgi:uncharacterized protein (TIGR03084 family)